MTIFTDAQLVQVRTRRDEIAAATHVAPFSRDDLAAIAAENQAQDRLHAAALY